MSNVIHFQEIKNYEYNTRDETFNSIQERFTFGRGGCCSPESLAKLTEETAEMEKPCGLTTCDLLTPTRGTSLSFSLRHIKNI